MAKTNIGYWKLALKNLPDSYKKWFDEERDYLLKHIPKDSKVLDIGCGEGRNLRELIKTTKNLTGIDHDKVAVKDTQKYFKEYPEVKILLAEAISLPLENKSFDYVLCLGTFNNLNTDKQKALAEMKRTLKDNGKIFISCYSETALEERMKLYKKIYLLRGKSGETEVKENGTVIFEASMEDNVSEQFSRTQLEEIFRKADLKVEEIKKVGIGYISRLSK